MSDIPLGHIIPLIGLGGFSEAVSPLPAGWTPVTSMGLSRGEVLTDWIHWIFKIFKTGLQDWIFGLQEWICVTCAWD